jgi:protein-S-isoprenylcysteine O-methyltransferase Ste14
MDIFGNPPIQKHLYMAGKSALYLSWLAFIIQAIGFDIRYFPIPEVLASASPLLACAGLLIALIGMANLGGSLRFGLPKEKTDFRNGGLYRFSRNPIYLGFDLISISSIVYTANPIVAVLGIAGIYANHLIILSEEEFLKKRFGGEYEGYAMKVRRYL